MTCKEFIKVYWVHYLSLEKEFLATVDYLAIDKMNELSYSHAYAKLILEIGSELDVVFKEFCRATDPNFKSSFKTIGRYQSSINSTHPEYFAQEVQMLNSDILIQPWIEWNAPDHSPSWWTVYNKVKHSRTSRVEIDGIKLDAFKFANQKYTQLALAGLYQLLVYFYYWLAKESGESIVTPMPGSRLFELIGGVWDEVQFYGESAFYLERGHLIWATSQVYY